MSWPHGQAPPPPGAPTQSTPNHYLGVVAPAPPAPGVPTEAAPPPPSHHDYRQPAPPPPSQVPTGYPPGYTPTASNPASSNPFRPPPSSVPGGYPPTVNSGSAPPIPSRPTAAAPTPQQNLTPALPPRPRAASSEKPLPHAPPRPESGPQPRRPSRSPLPTPPGGNAGAAPAPPARPTSMAVAPVTSAPATPSRFSAPPNIYAPAVPPSNYSAPAPAPSTPSTSYTAQSDGSGISGVRSMKKSPITVFATENFMIMHNNRDPLEDPLVIEKKNGHPGRILAYDKEQHLVDNQFSQVAEGEFVMGILSFQEASYLVIVTQKALVGTLDGKELYIVKGSRFLSFKRSSQFMGTGRKDESEYSEVEKFINSNLFYFSFDYPITLSLQQQEVKKSELLSKIQPLWKTADRRFFWNYHLARHFIKRRLDNWIVPVIRGFASVEAGHELPTSGHPITFGIISRISCLRAGTRYNARGINDDGNVANFVETEQIVEVDGTVASFLQIRGSVPVFWEQRLTKGMFRAAVTRTSDATAPAFKKHFEFQLQQYGGVHIMNLLDNKKQELDIANAYLEQVRKASYLDANGVNYTHWDFHAETKGEKYENILNLDMVIRENIERFGYFLRSPDGNVLLLQTGVFRTNCLDCLDRVRSNLLTASTNVVQGHIARRVIVRQLSALKPGSEHFPDDSRLGIALKHMWADNGDHISLSYAGTGAMKSSFTRTGKRSVMGIIDDTAKSLTRLYVNTMKDGERQEAIDQFLGNIEETIDEEDMPDEQLWVAKNLAKRAGEFTTRLRSRMYIGTWNVGGALPSRSADLDQWLSPEYPNRRDVDHDAIMIYIFGFQEIVELNASAIASANESNMRAWESRIKLHLNSKRMKSKLVTAGYIQLVGIGIVVFVQEDQIHHFRNFIIEKTKVGVGGLAGNKGALVARFDFMATSVACVCAHLAAGQKKVNDRIRDYHGIMGNTKFLGAPQTRTINDHDYVFWFGDFNFRIDMDYAEAILRVRNNDLRVLLESDQLIKSRRAGLLFDKFNEGQIEFLPTYKYDPGTDRYDTSEKKRVPAWCDRILWRNNASLSIEQLVYSRGELYESDHRPVKSLFDVEFRTLNLDRKRQIEKELYRTVASMDPSLVKSELVALSIASQSAPAASTTPASASTSTPSQIYPPSASSPLALAPPPPSSNTRRAAPLPPSGYSAVSREPAPAVAVRDPVFAFDDPPANSNVYSETHQDVLRYKASLESVKVKLQDGFGFEVTIKAATNLAATTIKALMTVLSALSSNVHAQNLAQLLPKQVATLSSLAHQCVANPNDKIAHNDLVAHLQTIIETVDTHSPYIR